MKTKLLLFLIFITYLSWGQTVVIDDRATGVGSPAVLPSGWQINNGIASEIIQKSGYYHLQRLNIDADYLISDIYSVSNYESLSVFFYYGNFGIGSSDTKVRVELSLDGGLTYPHTLVTPLAANTTNLTGRNVTLFFNSVNLPGLVLTNNVRFRFSDDDNPKEVRLGKIIISGQLPACTPPSISGTLTSVNNCGNSVISYNNVDAISTNELYWQSTATGTSTTTPFTGDRTVTTSGTYYLRRYSGNCWSNAISLTVTVNVNPSMSGDLTVTNISCNSSQISYNSASETDLFWQTSATGISTTNPYSALTITNSGTYYLRRLVNGCWSDAKEITVLAFTPNRLVTQPQNVNITVGTTATFTVASLYTSGTTYQWQVLNGSTWENISDATANTYNFTNAQLSDNGKQFRVIVTDLCNTLTSDVVTLRVTVGPCAEANFESDLPNGWSANSVTYGGEFCEGSKGAVFNAVGDFLVSPALSNPSSIEFFIKRSSNTTAWAMVVEIAELPGGPYNQIEEITSISTSCQTVEITIPQNLRSSGVSYIRFRDTRGTGAHERTLDNIKIYCGDPCQSVNLTSVFPLSGPAGTIVTITSTDDLSNQNIYFGSVAAQIVNRSTYQIQFIVPTGIYASAFSVYENETCTTTQSFEITNEIGVDCYGQNSNSVFISEVYDAESGSLGYVEIYNPTNVAVDLSTYKLRRYGGYTNLTSYNEAAMSGVIAPNATLVFKINNSGAGDACNVSPIQLNLSGINDDDLIELYNGTNLIDSVITPNETGYTLIRKPNASAPAATYNASDWYINLTENCASLGSHDYRVLTNLVTHNITLNLTCGVNQATIVANASVNAPAVITGYQWYVNVPNTTNWVALTDGADYTGVTSNTLQIISTVGKTNYQFYCAITSSDVTCITLTNAIVLKDNEVTTWDGLTWTNLVPSESKIAIINGNYDTLINGSFTSCSLIINTGYSLTIQSNTYVEVINDIRNNGVLKVEDKGQLVQVNDLGVNTGNIILDRKVMIKRSEYSQYSTPVQTANVFDLSPNTLRNRIWEWIPTINGNYGNWIIPAGDMVIGRGYGITAPNNFSSVTSQEFLATFTGIPNNGVINYQVSRGNYTGADYINNINNINVTKWDDNFNLIGNPYPSSISANDFILANQSVIEGSIEIWVPSSLSADNADPFYGDYDTNFSASSFIVYNLTGQTSPANINFNGYIGSAQAFFVKMLDGTQASRNIVFYNAMRSKASNNLFYRTTRLSESRIWLSLSKTNASSTNLIKRILVGYVNGATNANDNLFDAINVKTLQNDLYSLQSSSVEGYTIQGKQLPFEVNDVVPLGINIDSNGSYQISLDKLAGEIAETDQAVYLEDRLLNFVHNLKNGPYAFTANKGRYDDRFVIKYINSRLSIDDLQTVNDVIVFGKDVLTIQSSTENIKKVQIFDTLGRLIDLQNANDRQVEFKKLQKNNAGLIINIELQNGKKLSKKYIY